MTEVARLLEQLRLSFEGGAWHGPSVREALDGVTGDQAAARPIPGAHSIVELVLHLAGTYRLVLRRLRGDGTQLSPQEDWPAPPPGGLAEATRELEQLHTELMRAVASFPESRLDEPLVSSVPYTAHTQFIGITQHDLYHAGQIILLKRALTGRPASR